MKYVSIILVVLLLVIGGLLGKIAWDKYKLGQVNDQLNDQLMEANLEIGRAHTQFGNADKKAKDLEAALQKEINERNALITRYGELEAKYNAIMNGNSNGSSTSGDPIIIPTECPQFTRGMYYEALNETTLAPVYSIESTYQDFRLTIKYGFYPIPNVEKLLPSRLEYKLQLRFVGQLVETITPSGAINHYISIWEIDDKDNKVGKLDVTKFEVVVQDQRQEQFFWWAPHLDIGLSLQLDKKVDKHFGGSIGISAMGYGKTQNDLNWRFLRLGVDITDTVSLSFAPALWNIAGPIPLVSNIYFGPSIAYSLNQEWMLGLLLGAVL